MKFQGNSICLHENKKRTCKLEQSEYIDRSEAAFAHFVAAVPEGSYPVSQANLRLVEGTSVDKTKALDAALSQIERAFGKGSIMRLGKNQKAVEIETVPTGSLGLDIALGVGGLPRGRIVEIYGPESSGKTTLTLPIRSTPASLA